MEKIFTKTPNLTEENIEKLIELFPQVATEVENEEGKVEKAIDFDALRELLGDVAEGQRERYQFTWPGKGEAKAEARRPIDKTMIPCPEKSVDWCTTENLYIEGDNLDALKLLKETYAGKIKLIYIDPPYNTGHDFIYDDDFAISGDDYDGGQISEEGRLVANPESNGRFHSDWCSMIYPRLILARELLAPNGMIFISIDDNEYENLKKICNEVFGEKNFVATNIWQKRTSPEARKILSAGHEYVLAYVKNADSINSALNKRQLTDEDKTAYSNPDNDPRGPWTSTDFTAPGYRPNQMYKIETPSGAIVTPPEGRCWKNLESVFKELRDSGQLWFGTDGSGVPRQKVYLNDREGRSTWTWWPHTEVGHTQEATKEFGDLMERGLFDFPKPTRLMLRILDIASDNDGIVLDFFSGSASMADAIFQKNAEDGGSRKFILVQINEPLSGDYASLCEVGEERIRRAGKKIVEAIHVQNNQLKLGEEPKPIPDIGFRVFKIDSSNFKDSDLTPDQTEQTSLLDAIDNVKDGRTAEDILFQVLPAFRIPYSAHIEELDINGKKVFNVNRGQLLACFDVDVTNDIIEEIARRKPSYAVMRDLSFRDDSAAANFEELFKTFSPDTIRRVI